MLSTQVLAYEKTTVAEEPTINVQEIVTVEKKKDYTKEEIQTIVSDAAKKYGVSGKDLWDTIGCETQWTYDPDTQSKVRYNFSDPRRGIVIGDRERSFGLAAIHLPDHPTITEEQAKDPYFALEFMASHWEKNSGWWYCFK